MLEADGCAEMQRNELAQTVGCVPSQINYVLSSRFTQENGYVVESRRGGGGYIRITRVHFSNDKGSIIMHIVKTIGNSLDATSGGIILENLVAKEALRLAAQKLPVKTKFVVRRDYDKNA